MGSLIWSVAILGFSALLPQASASTILIGYPGDPATGDCAPLGCALKYQQIYGDTVFGTAPIQITRLTFFNNNFVPGSISSANYTISLSTTGALVNGLSTTFAQNVGENNQTFFSGTLGGPIGSTNQFTISGTPFFYDPTAGNLLLQISKDTDPGDFGVFLDVNSSPAPGTFSRAYSFEDTTTAEFSDNNYGLVTQFTFDPVADSVPEPSTFVLFGLGTGSLVVALRRRRFLARSSHR